MSMSEPTEVPGQKAVVKKNVLPILAIGLFWLAYACLRPLYKVSQYCLCAALSLVVYFILRRFCPDKTVYMQEEPVTTGDEQVDQLLKEGNEQLRAITAAANQIQNEEIRKKIYRLGSLCGRILAFLQDNPQSTTTVRRFINYYLPTLQKLTASYATLEAQGVSGENIAASMTRIEAMLDTMNDAFERQLDALFGSTALDLNAEITVMEQMLKQQGLTDTGDFKA
jgi:5-bromo-4-chloroindolyl phosphate hydrolysis protein